MKQRRASYLETGARLCALSWFSLATSCTGDTGSGLKSSSALREPGSELGTAGSASGTAGQGASPVEAGVASGGSNPAGPPNTASTETDSAADSAGSTSSGGTSDSSASNAAQADIANSTAPDDTPADDTPPDDATSSAGSTTATDSTDAGGTSGASDSSQGGSSAMVAEPVEPSANCGSTKWACWPMPNTAGSDLPNEASYTDNSDGTVSDNVTGLQWEQEQGSGGSVQWQQAMDYCADLSLGSFDDWRAPSRVEMASIVDYSQGGTKLDPEAFPRAPGGFHRTASIWILVLTGQTDRDVAWSYNLSDGIVSNNYDRTADGGVHCVRSKNTGELPDEPAVAPPEQYTALSDVEARDNYTGLIWQRSDSAEHLSWTDAESYCTGLSLDGQAAGATWRLPSIRELATLVDEAEVAPAINSEMFPNTIGKARSNDWYWASHQAEGRSEAAWAINFDDGFTGFNIGGANDWNGFTAGYARCVR